MFQYATTDGNAIYWNDPDDFLKDLTEFNGNIEVEIREIANKASLQQKRGHFGVIIPQYIKILESINYPFPTGIQKKNVAHYIIKAKYMSVRDERGQIIYVRDFHELTFQEVGEVWDKIVIDCAEEFGVTITLPEKIEQDDNEHKS